MVPQIDGRYLYEEEFELKDDGTDHDVTENDGYFTTSLEPFICGKHLSLRRPHGQITLRRPFRRARQFHLRHAPIVLKLTTTFS